MKFIICALYYNNFWDNTTLSSLTGDESGYYVKNSGFNFDTSSLNYATKYEYDDAIKKLDEINLEYSKQYPNHGFVIMSDTFKGKK